MLFLFTEKAVIHTKPIRIITQDFDLVAEINGYSSLHFTRKFHGIDELELTVNRHIRGAGALLNGRIIVVGADLHKAFIIRHREIALDESGKQSENWKIRALGLKSVIDMRLSLPPADIAYDIVKDNAETAMKQYVDTNAVTTEPERIIPNLVIAPNQQRGPIIEWQSRYLRVSDEVVGISELTGIGWNISLDYVNRKWVLDVAEGRNLTATQSIYPPVIFSPQFDSLKTLEFAMSDLNYRSVAYVAGKGEGVDRRVITVGEHIGMDRYELFVDASNVAETEKVDDVETPIPLEDIEASLITRGQQELAEYGTESFLSAQILTKSPFVYERDYDLGDIVTAKNDDWGVGMDARITEIKEIYEAGSPIQIEATFGSARPTFIDVIKKEFSGVRTELRR